MTSRKPALRTLVAYLRVSTDRQGRSGLGLEGQQAAITAFLTDGDRLLAPPFVEIESGRNNERPQLREALAKCRETGATLLIAKLDRLARDVHFISGLMTEDVPFIACDMPTASPFMLHIHAAVAEEEARAISRRTIAALAAAKARGVKLGGDRGYRPPAPPDAHLGGLASAKARSRGADDAARALTETIADIRAGLGGGGSLRDIARGLAERGILTPRGGTEWTATAVKRALSRIEAGAAA